MPNVKIEKNYAMWIDHYISKNEEKNMACIYIGLAEEMGTDYYYTNIPLENDGDNMILHFENSTNYKFIGIKTFENPRLNYRYSLGAYEFIEPDEKTRFNYMMLGRLQSDCEYVVGHLSNFCKRRLSESSINNALWGDSIDRHFTEMYRLYDNFTEEEKPEWLTREQIDEYKFKIKKLVLEE